MPARNQRWTSLAFAVAAALVAVGAYHASAAAFAAHLNSDLLYLVDLHHDLFVRHRDASRWHLPPAPYFFPDMALAFPLLSLAPDLASAFIAYGMLLTASLVALAYAMFRAADVGARGALACALGAGLFFVAAVQGSHRSTLVVFLPIFHSGSLVTGLALVVLAMRAARHGWTRASGAAFVALAVAITLSDLFSVTQFILPLLGASWLLARRGALPRATHSRTLRQVAVAAGLDVLLLGTISRIVPLHFDGNPILAALGPLLHPVALTLLILTSVLLVVAARLVGRLPGRWFWAALLVAAVGVAVAALAAAHLQPAVVESFAHELRPPPGWPSSTVRLFANDLASLVVQDPWLWLPAIAAAALLPVRALSMGGGPTAPGASPSLNPGAALLTTWFACAVPMILVEVALTWVGLGHDVFAHLGIYNEGTIRHMQPLFVLPPFVLAWSALPLLPRLRAWLPALSSVGAAALAAFAILRITGAPAANLALARRAAYPDFVRCIDEFVTANSLHAGYGDYWTARHVTMLSQGGVHLSPLNTRLLGPETWVENPAWFLPPAVAGAPSSTRPRPSSTSPRSFTYDFIVLGRLPEAEIQARFGPPRLQFQCSDLKVYAYDRPSDNAFRAFIYAPSLRINDLQ